ncbi:hypothetical protein [Aquihabitans sp. G128]|nr:hypothetical protein [Aquihabitans sp. G128]
MSTTRPTLRGYPVDARLRDSRPVVAPLRDSLPGWLRRLAGS